MEQQERRSIFSEHVGVGRLYGWHTKIFLNYYTSFIYILCIYKKKIEFMLIEIKTELKFLLKLK